MTDDETEEERQQRIEKELEGDCPYSCSGCGFGHVKVDSKGRCMICGFQIVQ